MVPALHDDRVDDAGQELLEHLHGPLLGGVKESRSEVPEQVVGRQGGRKGVFRFESASFGLQGNDLALERRHAVAARLLGELARLERLRYQSIEARLWSIAWDTQRSSR